MRWIFYLAVQAVGLVCSVGLMKVTMVVKDTAFWIWIIGAGSLAAGHIAFHQTEKWYNSEKNKNKAVFPEGIVLADLSLISMISVLMLIGADVFSILGLVFVLR